MGSRRRFSRPLWYSFISKLKHDDDDVVEFFFLRGGFSQIDRSNDPEAIFCPVGSNLTANTSFCKPVSNSFSSHTLFILPRRATKL